MRSIKESCRKISHDPVLITSTTRNIHRIKELIFTSFSFRLLTLEMAKCDENEVMT